MDELANHHTLSLTPANEPDVEFEHFSIPAYDSRRVPVIERGKSIKSNKTLIPLNSVLLSKLNPEITRVWTPSDSGGASQIGSTEFLVFTPRYPASRSLLFTLFNDGTFREMLQSMVTGTSRSHQRVPPKALKQRAIICGMPALFAEFDKLVAPLLNQEIRHRTECEALAQLREVLLPKLISGEVRVRATEQTIEVVP